MEVFKQVWQSRCPQWTAVTWIYFIIYMILFAAAIRKACMSVRRKLFCYALAVYVYNVLVTTLLMRTQLAYRRYDFRILYQFTDALHGNTVLQCELILNLLLFLPIGLLLPFILGNRRKFLLSAFIGSAFSLAIETTQLFTCLGEFQTDDVIANSAGAVAGTVLAALLNLLVKILRQPRTKSP